MKLVNRYRKWLNVANQPKNIVVLKLDLQLNLWNAAKCGLKSCGRMLWYDAACTKKIRSWNFVWLCKLHLLNTGVRGENLAIQLLWETVLQLFSHMCYQYLPGRWVCLFVPGVTKGCWVNPKMLGKSKVLSFLFLILWRCRFDGMWSCGESQA